MLCNVFYHAKRMTPKGLDKGLVKGWFFFFKKLNGTLHEQ